MAKFGPFNIRSLGDVAAAFRSLQIGLNKISNENLHNIGHPWKDWEPRIEVGLGAAGSVTIVGDPLAKYVDIVGVRFFQFNATCTFGAPAFQALNIELPSVPLDASTFTAQVLDGGTNYAAFCTSNSVDRWAFFKRYDSVNFAVGAGQVVRVAGFYRINP